MSKRSKKYTYEEIKNYIEIESNSGCELISKEYPGSRKSIEIKCKCTNTYVTTWDRFKNDNSRQCPECGQKIGGIKKGNYFRTSLDEIKNYLFKFGFILLDNIYINQRTKVNMEEIKTGYRYFAVPRQTDTIEQMYAFGQNNPYRFYNLEKFIFNNDINVELKNIFNRKEKNKDSVVWVILLCKKCNIPWDCVLRNFLYGSGCPICGHKKTTKELNLLVLFPALCEEWDYDKNEKNPEEYLPYSTESVNWICHKCGYLWPSIISSRTGAGNRCPNCCRHLSKGEEKIKKFLVNNNIAFIPEFKIEGCRNIKPLPFDFAVFYDINKNLLRFLIEYDGDIHYKDKFNDPESFKKLQERDLIKTTYCVDNNINLLRIPYNKIKNIEEILAKELNLEGGNIGQT